MLVLFAAKLLWTLKSFAMTIIRWIPEAVFVRLKL
jgi:hypothetical protein